MGWTGFDEAVKTLYEDIEIVRTITMQNVWTKEDGPDKNDVKVRCPNCDENNHPLLLPMTFELDHKRTQYKGHYRNREDEIIYGARCNKCETKYKFKLICNSLLYAKLGEY